MKGFMEKTQEALLASLGDTPLISVSQKPMDFGKNICVGDVGWSLHNAWRQLQIGAMEATTPFICTAEDDTLYPKEYFQFHPDIMDTFYYAVPAYHAFGQRARVKFFCRNTRVGAEGAVIIGREFLIRILGKLLDRFGMFAEENGPLHFDHGYPVAQFSIPIPILQFRVDEDMHRRCKRDNHNLFRILEPFGEIKAVLKQYSYRK
jgi:hypothetical protein